MIEYPDGLSFPLRDGYGFQPVSPIARTKMVSGRARVRRRFTSVPTILKVSWLFDSGQAQIFEAWFEYALKSGTLWFGCPIQSPRGFERLRARFVDIYEGPVLFGVNHWRFSAELEVFERPLIGEEWFNTAPDYVLSADIVDIVVNDKWPEFHEDPSQIILANDGVRENMKAWYERQELDE